MTSKPSTSRNLRQRITVWEVIDASDEWGEPIYDAPRTEDARVEFREETFIDSRGEEKRSRAVFYLTSEVNRGDRIAVGEHTDTEPVGDSMEVMDYREIPNLRNTAVERRAMV